MMAELSAERRIQVHACPNLGAGRAEAEECNATINQNQEVLGYGE